MKQIIGTKWYNTTDGFIGIVAVRTGMHKPEKGEWMAYIGRANGHNVEMDEQNIADWGAKVAPNIAHAFFPNLDITKYKEYDQVDWDQTSRNLEARSEGEGNDR